MAGLVALALLGCDPAEHDRNDPAVAPTLNLPAVPRPAPPIARAELLAAVAQAASASAAGKGADQRALDGREFELRIRFGCQGPATQGEENWLSWRVDEATQTLRLRAQPTITPEDALVKTIAGAAFENVEGFWVPRPWLLDPVCPASAAPTPESSGVEAPASSPEAEAAPPPAAAPKVGVAQFYTAADARTGQRSSRAYEAVKALEAGQVAGAEGFNLVLSGRLRALPGRSIILCTARGPDLPPDCIVSADFDRVWIEQPGNGEVIAEWSAG